MAEKITIAELDIDTDALVKKALETSKSIADLRKENKLLAEQGQKNTEQYLKNEVAVKTLNTEYNQQKKILGQLINENKEFTSTEEALNTALNKENKTIEQTRKNNKELLALRNKIDTTTEAGQKQLTAVNKKLNENNELIKENVSNYEQQKIGIGDYEGAIKRAIPSLGGIIDGLKGAKEGFVAKGQAMKGATAGLGGTTKALKLFRIALISTGIGAIVVALGTLISAFASTQKGIDTINRALAPLKGAFEGIIGVIQDISLNVFGQLGDRFTVIKNGILGGLDSIRLAWNKAFGTQEDVERVQIEIKNRIEETALAQERLNKKNQELKDIMSGATERIKESAKAQQQVQKLTEEIEKAEIKLIKDRSESLRLIKEQNKIAEDTTKTEKEREISAKRAIAETEKILAQEQGIIDLKIKKLELSQSQNDTDREGEKEMAELIAKRNEKETQALEMQTTLTNKLNTIRSQGEAKRQKEADEKLKKQEEEKEKKLAEEQAELDRIKAFDDKKNELQDSLEIQRAEKEREKEEIRLQQEQEKQLEELERLQLNKEEKEELQLLLEEQFREKEKELRKKYIDEEIKEEQRRKKELVSIRNQVFDASVRLFGEETKLGKATLLLKALFSAQESAMELKRITFKKKVAVANSSTAVAEGTAQTAKVGFPQNIPLLIAFATQVAGVISAIKSVSSPTIPKFEKGGLQEIGGKRHSQGGTKFVGEDGTTFEAERGELIGVMSRSASEKFKEFNDYWTPSFGRGNNFGKFESGGLINPVATSIQDKNSQAIDVARMIESQIEKVKIVQVVDDVTDAQVIQTEIRSRADI